MNTPKLSINVNKYALLRNSRGHNAPDLIESSRTCLLAGAEGITVHPRLDQRHVQFRDLAPLDRFLKEEFPHIELNIECEAAPSIIEQVLAIRPAQCTLVPVTPGEITSDHGWDLEKDGARLIPIIRRLKETGVRVSLFADCDAARVPDFVQVGADRIELYTGPYAWAWGTDAQESQHLLAFNAATAAQKAGLGLNAGHDLDRHNLVDFRTLPGLLEVSIGHAQICRALEVGTTQSVQELLHALKATT